MCVNFLSYTWKFERNGKIPHLATQPPIRSCASEKFVHIFRIMHSNISDNSAGYVRNFGNERRKSSVLTNFWKFLTWIYKKKSEYFWKLREMSKNVEKSLKIFIASIIDSSDFFCILNNYFQEKNTLSNHFDHASLLF